MKNFYFIRPEHFDLIHFRGVERLKDTSSTEQSLVSLANKNQWLVKMLVTNHCCMSIIQHHLCLSQNAQVSAAHGKYLSANKAHDLLFLVGEYGKEATCTDVMLARERKRRPR